MYTYIAHSHTNNACTVCTNREKNCYSFGMKNIDERERNINESLFLNNSGPNLEPCDTPNVVKIFKFHSRL